MKALASKIQSQRLDERAKAFGLSSSSLMDKAGFKASKWILKQFPRSSFSVFCGPGHNGGDGFVTAFYLKKAGRPLEIFSCESSNKFFNEKKRQAQSLSIKPLSEWKANKGQVLIDALFGVGLNRPMEGQFKELAHKINKLKKPVVALDIPSGLCASTGQILGSAIKADYTLSFALAKAGSYLNEGPGYSGKVFSLPIGFPKKLLHQVCDSLFLIQKEDLKKGIPSYKATANKTNRGHALILAGREGMWGCGLLACRGAYAVGSGYVTWASCDYPYKNGLKIPEALTARLKDKKLFYKKTAVGVGPGLGFSKEVKNFIFKLKSLKLPVVLDADALTLLAKEKGLKLNKNFLLTPHSGELSRLIAIPSKKIDKDRLLYARTGAKKYGSWLLLKGLYPVLSDGEKCWIIPSGNAALGKAGSGDVLTGLVTGLLAQGQPLFQAGVLGAFLQGETAKRWLDQGKDINSFSASHIINDLPFALKNLRSLKN